MDQHLAKLAAAYVAAARGHSDKHWSEGGERFRFTADGHTVKISFAGDDIDEEPAWRIIADGVVVKEADEEDEARASVFEEAWLILARLIRPTEADREATDLFWKASREGLALPTDVETMPEKPVETPWGDDEMPWDDNPPRLN
jgi:hypothetical protein